MWTPELEDEFLEWVLPCDSEMLFQRRATAFGIANDCGDIDLIDMGVQYLRRRSNRCTDYVGSPKVIKNNRSGLPFTWVEKRILKWAAEEGKGERRAESTPGYLAAFLRRTSDEIVKYMEAPIAGVDIKPFF